MQKEKLEEYLKTNIKGEAYSYELFDDHLVIKCELHQPIIPMEDLNEISGIRTIKSIMPQGDGLVIFFSYQALSESNIKRKQK